MLNVAIGLAQTTAEVKVAFLFDPWIVLRPAVEARLMDLRGEQLGQELQAASCQQARRAKLR